MSLVSVSFLLFILAVVFAYYIVPCKFRWIVLLLASGVFYAQFGIKFLFYICFTSLSVFFATNLMEKIEINRKKTIAENKEMTRDSKKILKTKAKKQRKLLLVICLLVNFGLLAFFKYHTFVTDQINTIRSFAGFSNLQYLSNIVAPIGISFYTFQTTGYLLDVYWEKYSAQKNPFKLLLFTSYFPQIIQGPIGRYNLLEPQFFQNHKFNYKNFSYGCQRMLWGYFKKMVVADSVAIYVSDVFLNFNQYTGLNVLFGAFLYSIQIYADFSGYMDIVCGFSEILGINLSENFERPYFSKSVAEYWRRWHITLGTWFKDYLYFPIALSKFAQKLGKKTNKVFSKHLSNNIPAVVSLIVVWFTTGLWHGASWSYISWGGLNGFFIILSLLLEPTYKKIIRKLRINETSRVWQGFQTLRTFLLITMIKVFPEVGSFSLGVGFIKSIFTNFVIPTSIWDVLLPMQRSLDGIRISLGVILIFMVSLIQRKQSVRDYLQTKSIVVRWIIYIALLFSIVYLGGSIEAGGGFMYAGF